MPHIQADLTINLPTMASLYQRYAILEEKGYIQEIRIIYDNETPYIQIVHFKDSI